MAKQYEVWVDVVEYDNEKAHEASVYHDMPFPAMGKFDDLKKAEDFAERLHCLGVAAFDFLKAIDKKNKEVSDDKSSKHQGEQGPE